MARANVVGVLDAGHDGTVSPSTAAFGRRRRGVLSARRFHSAVLLQEHAIKVAPTTMAAFVHKVTVEALLRRQWHVLTIPDLYPRLKHGVRGENVARAAVALVHVPAREVVPVHVLPVPALRQIVNVYVVQVRVQILLSVSKRILERRRPVIKLLLASATFSIDNG